MYYLHTNIHFPTVMKPEMKMKGIEDDERATTTSVNGNSE